MFPKLLIHTAIRLAIASTTLQCGIEDAAAQISVPPGWTIVDDRLVEYFIDAKNLETTQRSELVKSEHLGVQTERQNETSAVVRKLGQPQVTQTIADESSLVNPAFRRVELPLINTYKVYRIDTVKTVTTKTPYVDIRVTTYETRQKDTFRNTYQVIATVQWTNPFTGERHERQETSVQPSKTEVRYSDWVPREERTQVNAGVLTAVSTSILATRPDYRLASSLVASKTATTAPTGSFSGRAILAWSNFHGKVGAAARTWEVAGAGRVEAKGESPNKGASPFKDKPQPVALDLAGNWTNGLVINRDHGKDRYFVNFDGTSIRSRYNPSSRELDGEQKVQRGQTKVEAEVELVVADLAGNVLTGEISIGSTITGGPFHRIN